MNILVIYAHPNPNSFNAAILEQVKRGLKEREISYTVIDFYKDHFNPVLIVNDQLKKCSRHKRGQRDKPKASP